MFIMNYWYLFVGWMKGWTDRQMDDLNHIPACVFQAVIFLAVHQLCFQNRSFPDFICFQIYDSNFKTYNYSEYAESGVKQPELLDAGL